MKESIASIIEKLNALQITQKRGDWEDNIPRDTYDEYFRDEHDGLPTYREVVYNLDVDTHRWYETSTTVLKFEEGLMGVNYITNMFSESQDYEDCYHTMEFFEMEEFVTTSYRAKKD